VPLDISFAPQTSFTHFFLSLSLSLSLSSSPRVRSLTVQFSILRTTRSQISHLTFNASFSCFFRSIHGVRFSHKISFSKPHSRSNRARFVVLEASWIPLSCNEFSGFLFRLTSAKSIFLLNPFGFEETARKTKVKSETEELKGNGDLNCTVT